MNKILLITISILMSVCLLFSGCSLFQTNTEKQLNTVVAEVTTQNDTTFEVKRRELIRYYNNYYDTYVNNYGYTAEQTAEKCLDMIIDQRLLVDKIKEDGFTLTQNDKNEITKNVFSYVDDRLETYIAQVKNDWGITGTTESEDSDEENAVLKEEFTADFEYVNGEIKRVQNREEKQNPALSNIYAQYFWTENEKQVKGFTSVGAVKEKLTEYSNGITEEAMKRFVKDLKNSESYTTFEKNTSYDIFMREYTRVYEIYENNQYIQKLEKWYDSQFVVSTDDLLTYVKNTLSKQKELYDDENGLYTLYNEKMKSDATTVYYHPTQSWFYVTHILIPYSDAQNDTIKAWKDDLDKGIISQNEYDANLESMKSQIYGQARDENGIFAGASKSLNEIYNEIKNTLDTLGDDAEARIQAFDALKYKYSTDTGSFNKDFDYAIPLDSTYDTMVTPFANASRELYKAGKIGAISGIVMSDYGAHIVIYTGNTKNIVEDIDSLTVQDLIDYQLSFASPKTMFDLFCAKLDLASFSTYQSNLVSVLRDGIQIKTYKSRFSDIYNS